MHKNKVGTLPSSFSYLAVPHGFWVNLNLSLDFLGLYAWSTTGRRQTVRFKKMYYKTLLDQEVAWYDSNDVNKLATDISANMVAV